MVKLPAACREVLSLFSLADHLAASRCATTASLGAAFAVIHVMRVALLGTPVADVSAQLAGLLGERTVASHCVGAQPADRRALDTAGRTGIVAFLADHVREAIAAFGSAVVAGFDTVLGTLVQMMTHDVVPSIESGRNRRARGACTVELQLFLLPEDDPAEQNTETEDK